MVKGMNTTSREFRKLTSIPCEICVLSKMDKNTYPTSDTRATSPLAIIHIDMSGMMKVPSLNGSLYFQGILDDASKYSFSTFHKTKDTVPADTIAELERYENLIGKKIGKIFSDNATEYNCGKFSAWCRSKGITQAFTVPGNPSTNGAAERLNRTLHDRSTALLLTSKFPNRYWAEMVKSANTLQKLSPYAGSDQTPYEMFYGTKPSVDHLRIIGCTAYVHIRVKSRNFKTVKEALSSANSEEWRQAMNAEVTALSDMNTWSLADLPPGSKSIGTKWVFDLKRLVSGEIDRFKARLVAKGYAQRPGMDYDEVFAPVAKLATIRFILSMAADPAAHLAQLDVSTAFLNGIVEEEIYCTQPPGFEKDHRVCRMWKCLYGLKQASRQWYLKVKEDMIDLGFKEVDVDQGLFILPGKSNRPLIWVLLWVDDFLLLSFDEKILLQYKTAIMALYKTRDLGEPSVFVGFEITRNKAAGTLHICQSRFIKQRLKSHNMLAEPGSTRFPIPQMPWYHTTKQEHLSPAFPLHRLLDPSTTSLSTPGRTLPKLSTV
eukprot:gene5173-biopygen12229